ncbi:MAG TPA: MFS transporter [Stenomitos sp.]
MNLPSRVRALFQTVPRGPEGLLWYLVLLQSVGVTAVLPVLPLYATEHGADLAFIGWMVGAYMAANLVATYPAGWLSDRLGRRLLMAIGMGLYGLASLGFLCFQHPWAFVLLRAIEGVAGACFVPTALAYVADRSAPDVRGTRLAQLTAAQYLGLLVGPAIGGALASALGYASPFWVLAGLCVVASGLVARLPGAGHAEAAERHGSETGWSGVRWPLVFGVGARSLAGGFAVALYETVWAIYLKDLGASTWEISMSWTLFAVPPILLAGVAGRLIDRAGPAWPIRLGTVFSALIVATYAMTRRVEVLLALGVVDGIGFAFAYPAQNALMVAAAPEALRGRVIALVTALGTVGSLIGVVVVPRLYPLGPGWVFGVTSGLLILSGVVLAMVRLTDSAIRVTPAGQTVEV